MVIVLGAGKGAPNYEGLARAAREGDAETRLAALQALGKLGGERAVALLRESLGAEDVGLRRAAARALYQLLGERASQVLDQHTLRHVLHFRAPEEILCSPVAIRLFLESLDVLDIASASLDIEHGDGSVVSGSPMAGYEARTLRTSGAELDADEVVRRAMAFYRNAGDDADGWWAIGPMRGTGVISFRQGDRYGETLHELAIARIGPERYLALITRCRYADWD